jgi:PAS domain S-box-containing protein
MSAAEKDSLQEKEFLKLITENIHDAIVIIDHQGKVRYFSPSAEKMFGYAAQEVLGNPVHHLLAPEEYQAKIEAGPAHFQKTGQGKVVGKPMEFTVRHRDGQQFPIELIVTPVPRKEGFWAVAVIRDVSERKKLEEALARHTRSLETLQEIAWQLTQLPDDFKVMAQKVVQESVERLGLLFAWLGWAEPDGSVSAAAWYPESITYPAEITVRWDDSLLARGPVGRAIKSKKPQICHDTATDPRFVPWREKALALGAKNVMALPLISRGKVLGVLTLYSGEKNFFNQQLIDFMQHFAHITATALEKARLFEELNQRIERLASLHAIDLTVAGSVDFRVVARIILEEIASRLRVDAACILVFEPSLRELRPIASRGFRSEMRNIKVPLEDQTAGRVIQEMQVVHIKDLSKLDEKATSRYQLFKKEGFTSYWGVPLTSKGKVLGVLEVFRRLPGAVSSDWLEFLETLAGQVAIALENTRLIEEVRAQRDQLLKAYDETIEGWAMALSLKEDETAEHSQRVTQLTVRMAELCGLKGEELLFVRWGALLHDIGKIGIPDAILLKPGPLTPSEWEVM